MEWAGFRLQRRCKRRHRDKLLRSRCSPSPGGGWGTQNTVTLAAEMTSWERGHWSGHWWLETRWGRSSHPLCLDFIFFRGHRVRDWPGIFVWLPGAAGTRTLITTAFITVRKGRKGNLPSPEHWLTVGGQMEKISPAPGETMTWLGVCPSPSPLRPGSRPPTAPSPRPTTSHSVITLSTRHCALTQFLSCSYSLLTFPSLPATVKEKNGKTCKALTSAQRWGVLCLLCLTSCKPAVSGCSRSS